MAMPDFLSPMQGHFIATVREEDLKRWEEASRSSLVILSNLDAAVEAMVAIYPDHMQRNLYLMRSMFRVVQGLEALTRITVGSLHQAVTHRRNAALNALLNHKTKPLDIREDHLEEFGGVWSMKSFCSTLPCFRKLLRRGSQSQTNVYPRRHCNQSHPTSIATNWPS